MTIKAPKLNKSPGIDLEDLDRSPGELWEQLVARLKGVVGFRWWVSFLFSRPMPSEAVKPPKPVIPFRV